MDADSLLLQLEAGRDHFKRFLATRLGNEAEAEDVLQHGLVQAMRHAGELREETRLKAWFYRILRHALVDHVRRRRAAAGREEAWVEHMLAGDEPERAICACLATAIATLPPAQAELVQRVELGGETVTSAAAAQHLTPGNASVILHRARKALRQRLEVACGDCTADGCRRCDCEP